MIDLFPVQNLLVGGIAVALRPRGGDWLEDELRSLRAAGYSVLVSTLEQSEVDEFELQLEAHLATRHGIEFIAAPIPDRGLPDMAAAEALSKQLSIALTKGKHIAVHCRQGIGRSSLTVATVLVANGEAPHAAWARLAAARGRPVPDTEAQSRWLDDFAARVRR
jgi:protein-tyrosine phosphatase